MTETGSNKLTSATRIESNKHQIKRSFQKTFFRCVLGP